VADIALRTAIASLLAATMVPTVLGTALRRSESRAEREHLRLAIVPAFFGLGVVWHREAPWADAVAEVLDPWDRNPVLARLETNRVFHLAEAHFLLVRSARQQELLRRLLNSSAFSMAERLSRLRGRLGIATHATVVSKDEIRRVLSD